VLDVELLPCQARVGDRVLRSTGYEDLAALGRVLAELARDVDLVAEDVLVAHLEDLAEPDATAEDDLLLGGASRVDALTHLLHRDRAANGLVRLLEQDQKAVGFDLDDDAVVLLDDGEKQPLLLEHDLQEVNDAEFGDLAREAGEVREDDGPLLAEQIPDTLVDRGDVGALFHALVDELP
jgi:hypothetical protein